LPAQGIRRALREEQRALAEQPRLFGLLDCSAQRADGPFPRFGGGRACAGHIRKAGVGNLCGRAPLAGPAENALAQR